MEEEKRNLPGAACPTSLLSCWEWLLLCLKTWGQAAAGCCHLGLRAAAQTADLLPYGRKEGRHGSSACGQEGSGRH